MKLELNHTYRTRAGGTVQIVGQHPSPRLPNMWISDKWSKSNPGAYWYDNGVHPHNDENDLIEETNECK